MFWVQDKPPWGGSRMPRFRRQDQINFVELFGSGSRFKAVTLASLRSLVPKDTASEETLSRHEVGTNRIIAYYYILLLLLLHVSWESLHKSWEPCFEAEQLLDFVRAPVFSVRMISVSLYSWECATSFKYSTWFRDCLLAKHLSQLALLPCFSYHITIFLYFHTARFEIKQITMMSQKAGMGLRSWSGLELALGERGTNAEGQHGKATGQREQGFGKMDLQTTRTLQQQ